MESDPNVMYGEAPLVDEEGGEVESDNRSESSEEDRVLSELKRDRERLELKHQGEMRRSEELILERVKERMEVASFAQSTPHGRDEPFRRVQFDQSELIGGENHQSEGRMESLVMEMERRMMGAIGQLVNRIEQVEQRREVGDRRGRVSDRRDTLLINGEVVNYSQVPKSIRDPTITAKFGGSPREDIDSFVRLFKQQTELTDPMFATARLLNCLGETPQHAFRQHFNSKPTEVPLTQAIEFLYQRYRKPTHQHDLLRKLLLITQRTSAEYYFALLEEQLALVGVDPERCDAKLSQLLIAIVSRGLKEEVYKRLRQESTNFGSSYSYRDFKSTTIAIDNALHSSINVKGGDNPQRRRVAHVDVDEGGDELSGSENASASEWLQQCEEGELEEARAYLINKRTPAKPKREGSTPRHPAYKFPEDYRSDTSCRYCKKEGHKTPLCESLYKNKNRGESMPESMKASIKKILDG